MKFYSVYTESCKKDAEKLNLLTELNNIITRIESNQTSKFLEKYKSPAVVKRAGSYRFIGYEKIFDEGKIIFIVLLKILIKGKTEYEKFCDDSDAYCKKLLPEESWFHIQISDKENANIKEKSKLSKTESDYLFTPIPDDYEGSLMIYQSKRFNENIRKSDYKTHIAEIIRDIFENEESLLQTEKSHKVYSNLIVYYKFFSNSNLLFLYQTVNTNTGERIDKQEFEKICSSANTTEDILRVSFRSYPEYVLCDNDIWLEIQNESEGNLALSTEEAKIFNSIIHNKYEEPLFPLFINGRAGSGKSTLLYYTFAHILLNHIIQTKKLNTPPLFLTYSSKLLATASTSIKKILKTNVKIRTKLSSEKVNYVDSYLNSSDYNKSFKTFRGFQKELLSSIKKEQFEDQNYYSFSKFKEDWNKYCKTNPSKYVRGITSEFAWYVIRTFIKGILNSGEEFLEPDDYKTLPRELKTVEQDTYEKIYESVFDSWYKNHLRDIHFWDDQDLTKTVLENIDKLKLEYPAVFCDEAQDFSNIELELISELSLFSKRKIEFRDIKRIPLAFAGDPLQTINPTGFKWETIQANFYEKVQNDFGRYGKIPLNFKELNNNYRSNKPIVIFNNIIQLIRTLLFDLKNISPQKSWFTTEYSINPTLKINDLSIIEEALMEEGKTRTIIIPCEEDQEKDYIQNRDSFLKEKAIANDEVVQNIWGPMNVKGLEYNTVIVYNFGDYLANSLSINLKDLIGSLLASDNFQINLTESKRIELEYFLNKLYVATSRAKKNLVIVDTDMGNKFLWSVFNDFIKQLPIKYSIENNDYTTNWDEDNEISEFQFSSEVLDLADDKPEDLADQYYKDGLNSSNPRKLRTAAEYFKASKKPTEANRALAKALELENNYLKAAEYYEKIQDGDKAIQCLWKSNDANRYNKILSVYENLPKNPNNIFYLASEFVLSDNKKNNSILFLRYFASLIRDSENLDFYMLAHKSWENIYNEMLIALELYSRDTATLSDWDEAIKILKSLSEKGIQLKNKPEYMTLLFNLKQYKDIIEELTAANDLESELYLKSSAYSTSYPKNLEYYYKLKEFKIISDLYLLNEKEADNLNKTQKEIIFSSLIETKNPGKIESFLSKQSDYINEFIDDELFQKICMLSYKSSHYSLGMTLIRLVERRDDKLFSEMLKNMITTSDSKLLTFLLALFIYQETIHNRIYTVVDILENKRAEFTFLPFSLINKPTLEKVLLYALANKDDISKVNIEQRKRIQDYVKEMLVDDNRWLGISDINMAGAAIERLNMHINARDFYEKIYRNDFASPDDKEFAKRRWLKVKEKQAHQLQNEEVKKQIFDDIDKWYKNWNFNYLFSLDELEENPIIDNKFELTLTESYKTDKKIITQKSKPDIKLIISSENVDLISIKSIYSKNVIKIDNVAKSETIYFDLNKNILESKEINIFEKNVEENIKEYKISDWDMVILFEILDGSKLLKICIGKSSNPITGIYV